MWDSIAEIVDVKGGVGGVVFGVLVGVFAAGPPVQEPASLFLFFVSRRLRRA